MTKPDSQNHSHLFTVRLWPESMGDGQLEWRGRVCYIVTQEEHYFRDWATLTALLQGMLPANPLEHQPSPHDENTL